jgi:uncharacterized damage-inducible protein DinB
MSIAQSMLAEFEQEAKTTRKFLERIPNDKLSWKPHEKSHSAGDLALHIANVPGRIVRLARQDPGDLSNLGKPWPAPTSVDEILKAHDASAEIVRAELPGIDDASMQKTWVGQAGGKTLMSMPRVAFVRFVMLNHWIHHRGQLGVYLRLLGAKVPSSYGPSGDET